MVILTIASITGIIYKDKFDDGMEFFCPEGAYKYFAWRLDGKQSSYCFRRPPFSVAIKDDVKCYVLRWKNIKTVDDIIQKLLRGY